MVSTESLEEPSLNPFLNFFDPCPVFFPRTMNNGLTFSAMLSKGRICFTQECLAIDSASEQLGAHLVVSQSGQLVRPIRPARLAFKDFSISFPGSKNNH